MKKGEAKIEFYAILNFLQKEFEAGIVVSKFLYEKAKKYKNIKMTYKQFNKYFNDTFKTPKEKINSNIEIIRNNTETEPVRLKISTGAKKNFDPMFGKKFTRDDIL
jgi:hypothetical protein